MHEHIVIIGGTGMLKAASVTLAATCKTLTSVARTERSLLAMQEALVGTAVTHHMLSLDWSNQTTFLKRLSDHVKHVGRPSLALAWVHDDALGPRVANAICSDNSRCDFYHVRGSAAGDPAISNMPATSDVPRQPGLRFHEIILGFHVAASGSRWLLNHEICDGVATAIQRSEPRAIVGTVVPWSARP